MKELANHHLLEFINKNKFDIICDNNSIFWQEIINNSKYRVKILDIVIIESKDFNRNIEHLWLQENPTSNYADFYFNQNNYINLFKKVLERQLIKIAKVFLSNGD